MRPRARLISLLGDELISDECVALVELVKNAYDADASRVDVNFSLTKDELTIKDDGCGMSLETILGAWFEPGTVTKKEADRSPKGRVYQGAKGVGRFAAARLSRSLLMETKKEDSETGVAVLVEWGRFDDSSYLDDIELTYEVVPMPHLVHGTVLTLEGLSEKHPWSEEDYVSLHDRLSRLISPFEDTKGFTISLNIPQHPDLTGDVEPHPLTKQPKYHLAGEMSSDGHFSGNIRIDDIVIKSYSSYSLIAPGETVHCGGFRVDVRAWDRDREGLSSYMLKHNLSLTGVRNIIKTYSGVSIYRDGFRVHPYGESGNDWLGLDNRSRQNPTLRLANNQVIAAIRATRHGNPELKDRTTREGLVHNKAYAGLKDWFERVLKLLEEERYKSRPRGDDKHEETVSIFEVFDLSPVVTEADRQLGKQHPVSQLVRKTDGEVRDGVVRLQEHYSRLLLTAGLGQLVDLVIHEVGAPVARAKREVAHLITLLDGCERDTGVEKLRSGLGNVQSWLEQIVALRNRLDPRAAGRRGRSTTFDVCDEIRGNIQLFENLIGKQKVSVEMRTPSGPVVVKMVRSSLGQVIANLIDNSIYWITRHHGDGGGGRIVIEVKQSRSGFTLAVSDDGPGVEESDRARVFDDYFTTKSNGMGLGLYIAREVMERYGRISLCDEGELSGACFEAVFEKNVGL